jgi:hypothetical protein
MQKIQNGKQKALGVIVLLAGFLLIVSGVATNAFYLTILGVFAIGALFGHVEGFRQAKKQLTLTVA